MIKESKYCKKCMNRTICSFDNHCMESKAYQQGRQDVLSDIEKFKNSLDKRTNIKLRNACDIILEQIREQNHDI